MSFSMSWLTSMSLSRSLPYTSTSRPLPIRVDISPMAEAETVRSQPSFLPTASRPSQMASTCSSLVTVSSGRIMN